jgi:hypothetical protein
MKNNEDIKIAICFFGLTRSLKYTLSSIQTNVLNILSKNNIAYHIYLHTYNLEYLTNERSGEYNVKLNINEWKLLKPDFYKITNQDDFDKTIEIKNYLKCGDPWHEQKKGSPSVWNLLRQLNSLQIVYKMINKNYKCFLYLRPDLKYVNKLNINEVLDIIENSEQKIIYTPKWGRNLGLNERCYMGTKKSMDIVCNRINYIKEYSRKNKPHAERFMKNVINTNKIINKDFKLIGHRIRANGIVKK